MALIKLLLTIITPLAWLWAIAGTIIYVVKNKKEKRAIVNKKLKLYCLGGWITISIIFISWYVIGVLGL